MRNVFDLPMLDSTLTNPVSAFVRIAAIGPTTSVFLREKLNLRVDVVAPKPTAPELAGVINAAETDQQPRALP